MDIGRDRWSDSEGSIWFQQKESSGCEPQGRGSLSYTEAFPVPVDSGFFWSSLYLNAETGQGFESLPISSVWAELGCVSHLQRVEN